MFSHFPARLAGIFLLVVMTGAGCDREKFAGPVTGKVTYNGSPVTAGNLNFVSTTGAAASSKIDASGNFSIDEPLQAGEYKVFISPPVQEPSAPGTKPTTPFKFVVPEKFREPNSSGVIVTVKGGKNEIPVQFKD
jgi:hypothetical protein